MKELLKYFFIPVIAWFLASLGWKWAMDEFEFIYRYAAIGLGGMTVAACYWLAETAPANKKIKRCHRCGEIQR